MIKLEYSIVVTTYNDEKSIQQYIEEICSQTLQPREIIIADGGSKDSTIDIIKRIKTKKDINIELISGKRLNIAEGYNAAISKAKSEYIGVTGVGNKYNNDFFERLAEEIMDKKLDGAYPPIRGYNSNLFSYLYNSHMLNGKKEIDSLLHLIMES